METFVKDLSEKLLKIELSMTKGDEISEVLEKNLEKYIEKAKDTLKKKQIINPKPQKRFARIVESENSEDEETEPPKGFEFKAPTLPVSKAVTRTSSDSAALRPIRSAKINASKNLKELPANLKMRNENNQTVIIKSERVSSQIRVSNSRDSLKENSNPASYQKVPEDIAKENVRRSQSVEIIPTKPVEIDITLDDSGRTQMPPPPLPLKQKKTRAKKNEETDPTKPLPLRVTRSKIKKEKVSVDKTQSETTVQEINSTAPVRKSQSENSVLQKTVETSVSQPKGKKKYPVPFLIKIERESKDKKSIEEKQPEPVVKPIDENAKQTEEINSPLHQVNETFNLPNANQTDTISTAVNNETITLATVANIINNETVTIDKNPNDSLMTEDNDDEEERASMNVPLSHLSAVPPTIKLKKNEVFNPFMASPVKKKVEAFEKHAMEVKTPEKGKVTAGVISANKYNTLKPGTTPSKIALYTTKGTTPVNSATQKYIAAVTSASKSSNVKKSVQKKFTSMSHENQEELKKVQTAAQLEEKRRQREEKQKQVQLQREALEKQKREQTIQQQKEREEKFKKIMQEKEEQKRLEALKKKQLKEQQERKYAEEKARKEEQMAAAQIQPPSSASKDDSLYLKTQKQILYEKQQAAKKAEEKKKVLEKNAYHFDMLNTDDSTDDESRPTKKRPEPPQWSKKQYRKKLIELQSHVNSNLLDTLFSVQPIHVDLKDIFPQIDARKLARNSSAVWNTPPRYSVYAKTLHNH